MQRSAEDAPIAEDAAPRKAGRASMAKAAEALVRAGDGALAWEGATLASHFQPILAVRGPGCHGYEALLRAAGAAGERIAPADLFERAGDQRAALDWACRALHLRNYARFEPEDRTLFLNLHPQAAAHDARCARELGELVRYYGLQPRRVCVELLAGECEDERALLEAVAIYRELGIGIAIDDFGKGRSNFDRVLAIRPDVVKLDRALVMDAELGWGRARRMLAGMVELLHEIRARVVVSGIESAAEARVAIDAGADFVQGFHFSVPGADPADEAAAVARLSEVLRVRTRHGLATT